MDETEILTEKIKTLSHQLQQRDSEISSLKKQLMQSRSGFPDKACEKQGGKAASDLPEQSEKEIHKRVAEEIEKREKKFNEKFRDMQIKYEKELFTIKQMYDSVANKVESAMVQERTIEVMTRDIKILEDEKKNMKLLHLEILKQNQIQFEIKHSEAKKKMLEEIKKVQHNVSLSYLEQMDNSQKLTFLRNNQLEKEIDYRSVRMEELIFKNEKYESKIFHISQELENTKKSLLNIVHKNKVMGDMVRKLTESLINLQKEKDEEINKLCLLCEIEPAKFKSIVVHSANETMIKSVSSRDKSKKGKSLGESFRKKKSKSNRKSPQKKLSNVNSVNSNNSLLNEKEENINGNININVENSSSRNKNLNINNNNNSNNNYNENFNNDNEKYLNKKSLDMNTIKENEDENYNNENSVYNNCNKNINKTNSNLQEKLITSDNNIYSSDNFTSEKNFKSADKALNSPNSIKTLNQNHDYNSDLNASNNQNDAFAIKNKTKSSINKAAFGKEIKNLPLPSFKSATATQKNGALSACSQNNFNNAASIKSVLNSSSFALHPLKNREFISGADLLNSVVFCKNKSNSSIANNIKLVGLENYNLNLANNINSNMNINNFTNNEGRNFHNNLNSSQINPILNSIHQSINYSCNRVSGFSRDNNLYQIYEKKIKNLENSMREKEKEFFKLKFSSENLSEKLFNYEKKFQGIISLYEAGLKKLIEEEENLKNFTIVNFNFDFSTLKNFQFQKLSNENKFNLLVFLLNQIIPLIDVNQLESEFIKQNISMFKFKFYEEKLNNTAEKDTFFRSSVSDFFKVKSLKEGKNAMNYVNGTLRNMHYNASSIGNIIANFKAPNSYLKDEKLSLNRKLNMYDYQVIE
jgi:hypothetical protein